VFERERRAVAATASEDDGSRKECRLDIRSRRPVARRVAPDAWRVTPGRRGA
jgi:hypothetical protein